MIREELNLMGIIKSIFKLKAGLSAVIGDDKELSNKAKKLYFNKCTLYLDEQEEKNHKDANPFLHFLEQDEDLTLVRCGEDHLNVWRDKIESNSTPSYKQNNQIKQN